MKKEYISPLFEVKRIVLDDALLASIFRPEEPIVEETETIDEF